MKEEICKYLFGVQDLVLEEAETVESEEAPIKIQKVTLPETGKVIKARGNSLKQAFALVQAWNKTAKNMMNQVFSEERDIKTRD